MTIQEPTLVDHVFLVGRPPLGEYLGFITTQTAAGQALDKGVLADEWRAANDHIGLLEEIEAGFADEVEPDHLPAELTDAVEALSAGSAYQSAFGIVPTTFSMVELDRLVVHQKHINLAYVHELQASLPEEPTLQGLFDFCMSPREARPPVQAQQLGQNAFVFVSPSTDLRFLGSDLMQPDQAPGLTSNGHPISIVGIPVGYGSNYLNAVNIEGRLILNNGSHRAYALHDRGIMVAPMVIQQISRWDEVEVVGPKAVQQDRAPYLDAARPPVLKDYFDEQLRKIVSIPKRLRQIRVVINIEQLDVPG